jgi:hypothetical protein
MRSGPLPIPARLELAAEDDTEIIILIENVTHIRLSDPPPPLLMLRHRVAAI